MAERSLIPTRRQLEAGEVVAADAATTRPAGGAPDAEDRTDRAPAPQRRGIAARARRTLADADPRRIEGPLGPLLIFGAMSMLTGWDDSALGVLATEIRADLGLSFRTLATVASAVALVGLALAIPAGYLSDRVRRTWLVRTGAIVTNASSVVQATATGFGRLVFGRVAAGFGTAITGPASFSLMADLYPPRERTRIFGFFYLAAQAGALVGPLIAGALGQAFGWRVALGALGALATGVAMLTFLLPEPVRGGVDRIEAGASAEAAGEEPPPLPLGASLRAAWSIASVRRLTYATPFLYVKGAAVLQLLTLYFGEVFGLTALQRGGLAAAQGALSLVALAIVPPIADRILAERPTALLPYGAGALVLQAVCLVILGTTDVLPIAILASIPVGLTDIVLAPASLSLLSQVVPPRVRGIGLQVTTPAQLLGILAFPAIVGATAQGSLQGAVGWFAIPTLIAALVYVGGGPALQRDLRAAAASELAEAEVRRARREGRVPLLVARGVEARYGAAEVLFGVDLDVAEGEVLALVGPNGAGKTTLLRALSGVHSASGGAIVLDGVDVTSAPPHALAQAGVALVPGGRSTLAGLTVAEHLDAAASVGRKRADVDAAAAGTAGDGEDGERAAAEVEALRERLVAELPVLADRLEEQASSLSGGEQQVLALACALLERPRLLLVDELSLGLAAATLDRLLALVAQAAEEGTAVVLVEQSLDLALRLATRVVVLDHGEVIVDGVPSEVASVPGLAARLPGAGLAGSAGGDGEHAGSSGPTSARAAAAVARRARARRTAPAAAVLSDGTAALEVSGVGATFGGVRALRGVDLTVARGEVVGLVGPNGAGKTTLLDVVSGFVPADSGTIAIGGVDVTGLRPHERARAGLGRSSQSARLFPSLTVREAVLAALDRRAPQSALLAATWAPGARTAEARLARRADGLIEVVGVEAWASTPVGSLPTGTRRLVELACTLAFEPVALLLDEPTAGLSPDEAEGVPALLRRAVRETGCGVVVIDHDLPLLASVADRFCALVLGSVVADGPPGEVAAAVLGGPADRTGADDGPAPASPHDRSPQEANR